MTFRALGDVRQFSFGWGVGRLRYGFALRVDDRVQEKGRNRQERCGPRFRFYGEEALDGLRKGSSESFVRSHTRSEARAFHTTEGEKIPAPRWRKRIQKEKTILLLRLKGLVNAIYDRVSNSSPQAASLRLHPSTSSEAGKEGHCHTSVRVSPWTEEYVDRMIAPRGSPHRQAHKRGGTGAGIAGQRTAVDGRCENTSEFNFWSVQREENPPALFWAANGMSKATLPAVQERAFQSQPSSSIASCVAFQSASMTRPLPFHTEGKRLLALYVPEALTGRTKGSCFGVAYSTFLLCGLR